MYLIVPYYIKKKCFRRHISIGSLVKAVALTELRTRNETYFNFFFFFLCGLNSVFKETTSLTPRIS